MEGRAGEGDMAGKARKSDTVGRVDDLKNVLQLQ